jgi:glycosyltransferase involved in cell wall biosynthesis
MTQVSILTVTQYSRFPNLKLLYRMIQLQNYLQIKEWVIVEGSQDIALREQNITNINDFIIDKMESTDIEMRFIVHESILPLSNLRNIGNDNCKGDIIICMDDDIYYPPSTVPYVVEMLNQYNISITGCSKPFIYDYSKDKFYHVDKYFDNHSTSNCFAYKKSYLKNHRYEDGLNYTEESSFTDGFQEHMIHLSGEKCIILHIDFLNNMYEASERNRIIYDLMPLDLYCDMKKLYS